MNEHSRTDRLSWRFNLVQGEAFQSDGLVLKIDGYSESESMYPWMDPGDWGWKAVSGAVSDVYSIGGTPVYYMVSLGLRDEGMAEQIVEGVSEAVNHYGGSLVGGDLNSSKGDSWIDVAIIGRSNRDSFISRETGSPGDILVQVGYIGLGSAAYYAYRNKIDLHSYSRVYMWSKKPLIPTSLYLVASHDCVTASIDNSDGYARSLWLLSRFSGVRLVVDELYFDNEALDVVGGDYRLLSSGEDYNLFLLVGMECLDEFLRWCRRVSEWPCMVVGRALSGSGVYFRGSRLFEGGWSSF